MGDKQHIKLNEREAEIVAGLTNVFMDLHDQALELLLTDVNNGEHTLTEKAMVLYAVELYLEIFENLFTSVFTNEFDNVHDDKNITKLMS